MYKAPVYKKANVRCRNLGIQILNFFSPFKNLMEKHSYEWRENVDNNFFTRAILADHSKAFIIYHTIY